MKNILTATFLTCLCITGNAQINHGYPIDPVPFTSVKVTDSFWGQRLQASREVTIPLAFSKCEETGRYENFIKAAHPSDTYKVEGFSFDDTDVYKTIEGASYSLQTYPDKKLQIHRQYTRHCCRSPRTGRLSLYRPYHEPEASAQLGRKRTLGSRREPEP